MNIGLIILFIIIFFLGSELGYYFYYSPKATIRRLLKGMYKDPIKLARIEKELQDGFYYELAKKLQNMRWATIKALLSMEYYFDPIEDKEYIEEKMKLAQSLLDNVNNIFGK